MEREEIKGSTEIIKALSITMRQSWKASELEGLSKVCSRFPSELRKQTQKICPRLHIWYMVELDLNPCESDSLFTKVSESMSLSAGRTFQGLVEMEASKQGGNPASFGEQLSPNWSTVLHPGFH